MKSSFRLKIAKIGADFLVSIIKDYCEKIEILGSIRREKEFVGDIEILAIPLIGTLKRTVVSGLGKFLPVESVKPETNLLNGFLEIYFKTNKIEVIKNGPKVKQFMFPFRYKENFVIQVDLFQTVKNSWGLQKMIRTGSADYSKNFMIELNKRKEYKAKDGFLWNVKTGILIKVESENKLFDIVGFPQKEPWNRIKGVF
jgi:DNA polymerase/3'-5' exonuclease PolX